MQSISVFFDIAICTGFRWKNAGVSRTQRMYHVTHIFLGPSLGKVQMCQFSSLSDMRDRFFFFWGGAGVSLWPLIHEHTQNGLVWMVADWGSGVKIIYFFCRLTNEWQIVSLRVTTFPLFFSWPFLVKPPFLETFSAVY